MSAMGMDGLEWVLWVWGWLIHNNEEVKIVIAIVQINEMGYAMIGECIDNISLLIGLKEENRDKIYIEDSNIFPSGDRILFVSNNIFEFVKYLSLNEKENVAYGIKSYTALYKKWGEDFWRISEENESNH